jgi:hypothetical protein
MHWAIFLFLFLPSPEKAGYEEAPHFNSDSPFPFSTKVNSSIDKLAIYLKNEV